MTLHLTSSFYPGPKSSVGAGSIGGASAAGLLSHHDREDSGGIGIMEWVNILVELVEPVLLVFSHITTERTQVPLPHFASIRSRGLQNF